MRFGGELWTLTNGYLKKCNSEIKLEQNATDGPNITSRTPAKFEDDFRSTVMSRRHNRWMMLMIERRRAEIYQLDASVSNSANFTFLREKKSSWTIFLPTTFVSVFSPSFANFWIISLYRAIEKKTVEFDSISKWHISSIQTFFVLLYETS